MPVKSPYKMRKHPKCYSGYYVFIENECPSGCKIVVTNIEQQLIDKHSPRFSPKKHWCYLCYVRTRIVSLSTSSLLGSGYRNHIECSERAINSFESVANLDSSSDQQIFELTQRLHNLLDQWNIKVYLENKQAQGMGISPKNSLNSDNSCENSSAVIAAKVRRLPGYQSSMDWYCSKWPQEIERLIDEVKVLSASRKGQRKANGTDENFQLTIARADKIWRRQKREGRPITNKKDISKKLSATSRCWSHDGKKLSEKTIRGYLDRWEGTPPEASRAGGPRNSVTDASVGEF